MADEQPQAQRSEPTASRPQMPAYYGVTKRNSDPDTSWTTASDKLASAHDYWISTTNPDGSPHAMPIWGIWMDETFYFDTGPTTRSGRNIAANPRMVVHLESGSDCVILEGTVAELHEPALLNPYADAYEAKYNFRPDVTTPDEPGSYVFRPHKAFTWQNPFADTALRWTFDQDAAH